MDSIEEIASLDLILFDGVCNLCNGAVQFIIKHDTSKKFSFGTLQSEKAQRILRNVAPELKDLSSIVYLKNGKALTKSTAALHICKHLSYPFKALSILLILPPMFRDFFYDLIAQSRYRLFGRTDNCMLPGPALQDRFPYR